MIDEITNTAIDFAKVHGEWVMQLFVVLVITWLANSVLQKILRRVDSLQSMQAYTWHRAFVSAASLPLRIFIWIGGLSIGLYILQDKLQLPILKTILGFQPITHTLIIGWFIIRFVNQGATVAVHKYPDLNAAQADTIQKVLTAIIAVAIFMLILPNFGISISGLLAFGGVGGIIVGMAAKDMLANLFGALVIYFDRPFAIGDWVYMPEKNIQGTVEHIGWRQVSIRTFDKRLMFIPNSLFGNLILVNPSKMTHRRIYEVIGVRYQDIEKLPAIIDEIRNELLHNPDLNLDRDSNVIVHLDKLNTNSLDILISAFTQTTEWPAYLAIKEKVLFMISRVISKHEAEIASPAQVMQIDRQILSKDVTNRL